MLSQKRSKPTSRSTARSARPRWRNPVEKAERIAIALARVQFPHKDWNLLSPEEKDFYLRDAEEFIEACNLAGITLT